MPNYCNNILEITGHQRTINKLYPLLINDKGYITFNKILPTPEHFLKQNDIHNNDWYQWRMDNWGTKWDATLTFDTKKDKNLIVAEFNTAWTPPIFWIIYLTKKYKKLDITIKFCEPMGGIIGVYKKEKGKVVLEDYFTDYNMYEEKGTFDELLYKRIKPKLRNIKIKKIINNKKIQI